MRRQFIVFGIVLLLAQLLSLYADPGPFGTKVLGLYKSSEGQTAQENEIFFYLSQPLREMGISIDFRDIDRGTPEDVNFDEIRAVISWFRGPSMLNPHEYLRFLNDAMDHGTKVLVLDNFGVYQDRATEAFLSINDINSVLVRLGLLYQGDWTQDGTKIEIAHKESRIMEFGASQDPLYSKLFYRFRLSDSSAAIHLSLRRLDRSHDPSPVIVTNRNGGFALSRYIFRYENNVVTMMLNVGAFLREALFPPPTTERIALIHDPGDAGARNVTYYTTGVLKRTKLPFDLIDMARMTELLDGDLRRYTAIGIIVPNDQGIDPELIGSYLDDGGSVVALMGGDLRGLAPHLGSSNSAAGPIIKKGGYRIRSSFLLGEGLSLEDPEIEWRSGWLAPDDDADVLMTDVAGVFPLAWVTERGRGTVLVWNWDGFGSGDFLGWIVESFLYVRPVGVAATVGLGMIHLDDWPRPMYNAPLDPLSITDTEFYTNVWWPDIKTLLGSFGIPYTALLVFNYNGRIRAPFGIDEFFVAEGNGSVSVSQEIIESGAELGLHGYNHQSYALEGTSRNLETWESLEDVKGSLIAGKEAWIALFGEHTLPVTYVPPHNVIDEVYVVKWFRTQSVVF